MKKFDTRNVPIVGADEEAELKGAFDILEEVQTYAQERLGIQPYPMPSTVPRDLAEYDEPDKFTNDDLALLHAQYTAYASFIGTKLAEITAAQKLSSRNLKNVVTDLTTRLYAENTPKTEIAARVKMSPIYREFELEDMKLTMMRIILDARYQSYDKQAKAISRLVTIRQMELEKQLHDAGITNRSRKRPAGSMPTRERFRGQ